MSASIPDSVKARKRYTTLAELSTLLICLPFPCSSGTCSPH
ncbi:MULTISPECIES: hypothetical protein [Corynebacterium]|nr:MULTISPECIES: hypothetical protein [Corynebacterium]MDK6806259.1 hypothetical protein [Corynebacterium aurimucosum]MDK6813058.1 hypothetical protein [Corynebacterium sp. UMB6689]WJY69666.1 hypothetical protein CAURIM_02635 [Corynebacterium aurimucosum]